MLRADRHCNYVTVGDPYADICHHGNGSLGQPATMDHIHVCVPTRQLLVLTLMVYTELY